MNAQTSEPPPRSSKRRLLTASLARRIRRAKAPFTRWTWTELPDDRSRFLLSEQVCVSVSTCLMGRLRGHLKPRGLDRPMIGGVLERREPIAALDFCARELCPRLIRTQPLGAQRRTRRPRNSTSGLSMAFNAVRRSCGSAGNPCSRSSPAIGRSALLRPFGSGASNLSRTQPGGSIGSGRPSPWGWRA